MTPLRRVCVFAGSSPGRRPELLPAARALGAELAARGLGAVYGGAKVGLMGAMADAALAGGAEVIGVIPEALVSVEVAHDGLTDLRVVPSMHERKALMAALSDGFIALPGGFGTFEEILEITTWCQLGIHAKPCALLDVAGYWDHLLAFLDRAVDDGLLRPEHRALLLVGDAPGALLDAMEDFRPRVATKWMGPGET